ncbi:unnamed protein product [Chrysoparadoxa australica]
MEAEEDAASASSSGAPEIEDLEQETFLPPVLIDETPDKVALCTQELRMNLEKDPAWEGGREYMTDSFLLRFLRCERFNPTLAAKRVRKYWKKRRELFGDELARQPTLTCDDGVRKCGWLCFEGGSRDNHGRQVLVVNPGAYDCELGGGPGMDQFLLIPFALRMPHSTSFNDLKLLGCPEYVKMVWCIMHEALEGDEETQRKGFLVLAIVKTTESSRAGHGVLHITPAHLGSHVMTDCCHVLTLLDRPLSLAPTHPIVTPLTQSSCSLKWAHFDMAMTKTMLDSFQGALPVRVGGICILYAPWVFSAAWAVLRPFMSQRMRSRVMVLRGDDDYMRGRLLALMPSRSIPEWPMGGGSKVVPSDQS